MDSSKNRYASRISLKPWRWMNISVNNMCENSLGQIYVSVSNHRFSDFEGRCNSKKRLEKKDTKSVRHWIRTYNNLHLFAFYKYINLRIKQEMRISNDLLCLYLFIHFYLYYIIKFDEFKYIIRRSLSIQFLFIMVYIQSLFDHSYSYNFILCLC